MPSYQTPTGQDTTITLPTGAAIIALGIGGALALRSVLRDHVTLRAEVESIADARTGRISEHLIRLEREVTDLRDTMAAFIEEFHHREQDELGRERRRRDDRHHN